MTDKHIDKVSEHITSLYFAIIYLKQIIKESSAWTYYVGRVCVIYPRPLLVICVPYQYTCFVTYLCHMNIMIIYA